MRIPFRLLLALLLAVSSFSQIRANDPPDSPADQFQQLLKQMTRAQQEFNDAYNAAKTSEEKQRIVRELGRKAAADYYVEQVLDLMRRYPQDDVAFQVFGWMISRVRSARETDIAADLLLKHHLQNPKLQATCLSLTYYPCRAGNKVLQAAMEKSPHRAVQGYARFALALSLRRDASRQNANNRQEAEAEADRLLRQVTKSFADLVFRTTTLGQAAEMELFELQHLSIGKRIPEIEGKDLHGKPLKLSDFRGKIVLVVFWATWCGPCMADVPHEVELAKKYHDQPFQIIGINADEDNAKAREACRQFAIPWPSFADGKNGPIATRWNVHSWPTLYLVDAQGTIRYKTVDLRKIYLRSDENGKRIQASSLDDALETLLKEFPNVKK